MAQTLTCPQGHQWQATEMGLGRGPICPVCGATPDVTLARPPGKPVPAAPAVAALPSRAPGRAAEDADDPTIIHTGPPLALTVPPPSRAPTGVVPPSADQVGDDTLVRAGPPPSAEQSVSATLHPPAALPRREHWPSVPGYEVVGLLGRGGMGAVYKARHLRLKRLVALKMILAGSHADPDALARFRTEGEAVARLQHPNIVQIYEVGEHAGAPYFSLEYVEGGNLHERLNGTPQPGHEAAALVEILARAMHHAHQQGIVHRDLKPANILLARTDEPSGSAAGKGGAASAALPPGAWLKDCTPKIADFGLAKCLGSDSTQTRTGTLLGTPSYMAPEQAGTDDPIGPATDVYALGAILYDMITGRPPFRAETALDTAMQVIRDDPVAPRQLNSKVPRDLETICLKCLEKPPARRYASAAALADDLRRFLNNEPIEARPAGRAERAVKWARRRPALASLLGVASLAVAGLLLVGAWFNVRLRGERDIAQHERDEALRERRRAEVNVARAMRAIDQMLTEVAEEDLAHVPRMEEKRKALLKKALEFYHELFTEESNDPLVRKETGLAHKRLGDVLRLLGNHEESRRAYGQAIALLDRLAQEYPDEAAYRHGLAESYNWLGEALRPSSPVEAEKAYREAARLQGELMRQHDADPAYPRDLARSYDNLGILFGETGERLEAQRCFTKAAELLHGRFADRADYRRELAKVYLNLGPVLRAANLPTAATTAYDKAIELLKDLADRDPDVPGYRYELAVAYNNLGILFRGLRDSARAQQANEKAYHLLDALHADFPRVVLYGKELAVVCNSLALVTANRGAHAEAEKYCCRAKALLEGLIAGGKGEADAHARLGMVLGTYGWLQLQQAKEPEKERARLEAGARALEKGTEELRAVLKTTPGQPAWVRSLREQYVFLGQTRARLGDHAGAARATAALVEAPLPPTGDTLGAVLRAAATIRDLRDLAAADARLLPAARRAVLGDYAAQVLDLCRDALALAAAQPEVALRSLAPTAGKK